MPLPTKKSEIQDNYLKHKFLIYGIPKIGKTTIASRLGGDEGDMMFFTTESGHDFQEIFKYEVLNKSTGELHSPTSWSHFLEMVKELTTTNDHSFKGVCIDTVDNLWEWCAEHVMRTNKIKDLADMGYGKGFNLAKKEFSRPINYLSQMGYGIVFLSHAKEFKREKGPREITYIDSSLPNSPKKFIHGLVDFIFYFHADSEGKRWIATKGTDSFNAGDRSGRLDPMIEMDADILIQQMKGERSE